MKNKAIIICAISVVLLVVIGGVIYLILPTSYQFGDNEDYDVIYEENQIKNEEDADDKSWQFITESMVVDIKHIKGIDAVDIIT